MRCNSDSDNHLRETDVPKIYKSDPEVEIEDIEAGQKQLLIQKNEWQTPDHGHGFRGTTSALQVENTNFNEILIPVEDKKKTGCCWRLFCPCYYLLCCCLCCESGMKITKIRFIHRFQKWITIVSSWNILFSSFYNIFRKTITTSLAATWTQPTL